MATIFQTAFSNAFSWMKMYKFPLRFNWSLFPRVQLTIFQVLSHYLNQWWLDSWHISALLSLNELIQMSWHLPERTDCIKGKHPLIGWCESGDHLLASGVGILRLRRWIPPPDASKWSPDSHQSGDHLLASDVGILRLRRWIPPPDASKWSPDSHHPMSGCFPFIPYLLME